MPIEDPAQPGRGLWEERRLRWRRPTAPCQAGLRVHAQCSEVPMMWPQLWNSLSPPPSLPPSSACDFVHVLTVCTYIRRFCDTVDHRLTESKHSTFSLQLLIKLLLTEGSEETAGNPTHIVPGLPELTTQKGLSLEVHLLWARH